jgi:hypothetical protein
MDLKRYRVSGWVWIGFMWLRIGINERAEETSGSQKDG